MSVSDAQKIETSRRRNRVVQLRESGATWEAIATALMQNYGEDRLPSGWDRRYAYKDFHRRLEKIQKESEEAVRNVREMELRRLDRMQRALWERATNGDTDAIDRILRIQKRRAKLLGLDSPEKVDLKIDEIDWDSLSDEQLRRIAEGEPPENVVGQGTPSSNP